MLMLTHLFATDRLVDEDGRPVREHKAPASLLDRVPMTLKRAMSLFSTLFGKELTIGPRFFLGKQDLESSLVCAKPSFGAV